MNRGILTGSVIGIGAFTIAAASFFAGVRYADSCSTTAKAAAQEPSLTATQLFDLQSKCAALADRFADPWDSKKDNKTYRRRNHYNVALQKCFLRLSYQSEEDGTIYQADQIKDVLEGAI